MSLAVSFGNRDFSGDRLMPRLEYKVARLSNQAVGGPKEAEITATGADLAIWECLELLRCPVTIFSEQGDAIWWGYVAEATVTARNPFTQVTTKTQVGANLETMYNNVAVAWEDIAIGTTGGERFTTAWVTNGLSTAEYGTKDGLFSGESASDSTLANQARDVLLDRHKFPIPIIQLGAEGESEAVITCRGWWSTLAWRYAPVPAEVALAYWYDPALVTPLARIFGTTTLQNVAQGIDLTGGDVDVVTIHLMLRKVGTPTDNLTIELRNNPDDLTPTTTLATSAAVVGSTLTTAFVEYTFTFTPYTLTSGASYFILVQRSGAMNNSNYYEVAVNDLSLPGYWLFPFVRYSGTAWAQVANRTMFFRIFTNALVATSTQILSLLSDYGQFFSDLLLDVASGVVSESYRDGDGTAQFEIEQLMRHGTTNLRRMLAAVDEFRRVRIYEEPAAIEANTYQIFTDGSMVDAYGGAVRNELAQAGVWARLVDVIPPSVDSTFLGSAMMRFIEITEYDATTGKMTYTAREELDPFEIGRPYDG